KSQVVAESPKDAEPGRDDVRRALDRVLVSEMFRGSPKLAAFLRFVVETTLRGEQDRIKGYTIGVEALGREDSFDPQIDPIGGVDVSQAFDGPLRAGNGMPTLAIPRIRLLALPPQPGAVRPQLGFATTLAQKLHTAMARFDTLNVVDEYTDDSGGPGPSVNAK